MKITGIIPPMVTPFCENESLDCERLRDEVTRLRSAHVHGLSFAGSTGEGPVLSDEELFAGIHAIRSECENGFPVICGIIRNSTKQALSAALAAKSAGADALMVTPTYYFGSDSAGNISYFDEICEATKMPVIIYNVIKNNPILPKDIPMLKNIPGIIGIKQSVGGVHAVADMVQACSQDMIVYAAQDDVMFLSYLCGVGGAISAILTLFPELFVEQWKAVQSGDIARARSIHNLVLPVWRTIEGDAFPGRLKAALDLLGVSVGKARRPILPPDESVRNEIRKRLHEAGFIR